MTGGAQEGRQKCTGTPSSSLEASLKIPDIVREKSKNHENLEFFGIMKKSLLLEEILPGNKIDTTNAFLDIS